MKLINRTNWLTRITVLTLLLGIVTAQATYWCYFVCGNSGEYLENGCDVTPEDPCAGTCTKYIFTANVTCYCCDIATFWGSCGPNGPVYVPASKYVTSCGEYPPPALPGQCQCLEPWILDNPSTGFVCYTTVTGRGCL